MYVQYDVFIETYFIWKYLGEEYLFDIKKIKLF